MVAGLVIIYEASLNLLHPHQLQSMDYGIALIATTAIVNYIVGEFCVRTGKKNNSLALIASGTHLKTDTYTTGGLVIGLILLYFTGYRWLDSVVAIVFAFVIIRTGFLIIRQSVSGIMDEADANVVEQIVKVMSNDRQENWVDLHNLRIINYAGFFHIDCHVTVPRYFTVEEAHKEIDKITNTLHQHFEGNVEFSIHTDGCIAEQCAICSKKDCPIRQTAFVKQLEWTTANFVQNQKHQA